MKNRQIITSRRLGRVWGYLMVRWNNGRCRGWTYKRLIGICEYCEKINTMPWKELNYSTEIKIKLDLI